MQSLFTSDKKKAMAISLVTYGILLLILFFIRFWPPSNPDSFIALAGGGGGGITVNFGDSEMGSGAEYQSEKLEVKSQKQITPNTSTPDNAIITQENATEESVVIPKKEKIKVTNPTPKENPKPIIEKPKVSNATNDALASILKGSNKGGDGDDKVSGNKGKINGSLGTKDYYGSGGTGGGTGGGNGTGDGIGTGSGYGAGSGGGAGGGTGYSLGNRKAISKPVPKYTCNEIGKVVVEVSVDRNGNTISAIAGSRGTTNTAKCLLDQAKIAAMNTKWDASASAPEKQVGKIVYNFNMK